MKTATQRFIDQCFAEEIKTSFWPDLRNQSLKECIDDALDAHNSLGYRLEAIREKFCRAETETKEAKKS
jgi:hypothetical protein